MRRLPCLSIAVIVCATVLLVVSPVTPQQSAQEPTLQSDVNLVSVYFTVRDSHKISSSSRFARTAGCKRSSSLRTIPMCR
jgi:hypothetical protein